MIIILMVVKTNRSEGQTKSSSDAKKQTKKNEKKSRD
jgi:hypothetical protein